MELAPAVQSTTLPAWALTPAAEAARPVQPLSPSDLGGAKALPGEGLDLSEDAAKTRGTAIHLLLEHLPQSQPDAWPHMAEALITDAALRDEALAVARKVLENPALAWLFTPDTLAEVPFVAPIGTSVLVGTIDRLVVGQDRVVVVDFKSNALVPDHPDQVPEGLLRQMGAYVTAMRQIYPDRPIEAQILWTATAQLMPLDPEVVTAALQRTAIP